MLRDLKVSSCTLAILLAAGTCAHAQEATSAPAELSPATAQPTPAQPVAPTKAAPTVSSKKGKQEYTGPMTVVELPPTPVLDGEGRQRLDPDGKPMFNPPIFQIRDKKGHPVFDENGKPVFQTAKDLGYDARGKKIDARKEKPPKTTAVAISHGTFTVDGMTGKAALNYDIADFKYVYLYVPWIGTTIISNAPFPGSKEEKDAFSEKTLTVHVGEHTLQLYSDSRLLGKKPESAYVAVDRDFKLPTQYPVVGYGATTHAPYDWPGAKAVKVTAGSVMPPPLPESLRPTTLLSACPTGQMRMPGPKPLPGQVAPVQPCVPIEKAIAARPTAPALPATPALSAPETPPAAAPTVTTPAAAPPADRVKPQ